MAIIFNISKKGSKSIRQHLKSVGAKLLTKKESATHLQYEVSDDLLSEIPNDARVIVSRGFLESNFKKNAEWQTEYVVDRDSRSESPLLMSHKSSPSWISGKQYKEILQKK